jgi:signal transduction histidine kinase
LDWRALRRWHIDEARVPRGTRLDYRDPDVWTRYRAEIGGTAGVLIVQTAMIGGLLVQRRRRQRAERRALESEARLRATCDRLHDVGKRLIEAQEIERSHIARELHDDLSQQAALLTVRLDLLRSEQYLPDESATLIEDAFESATEISHSLRDLSHRLHPARLRLLGLVPALVGLQRELTTSGTTIHFSHEGVPPGLGFDLTLCFFRVVQEAVQNAVRHGSASHVFVHLSGAADRLSLTIRDNGTGFDVERAWGKGLGLISIAERLESLGGTFAVRSRPGVGSCLEIAAPVPDRSAVVVA